MGIPKDCIQFLFQAKAQGVQFGRTLTLGRQDVTVGPERLEKLIQGFGAWPPPQGAEAFRAAVTSPGKRFEALARTLGAQHVEACDASAYEGATFLHDLNLPIPADRAGQYDVVIDGGTLEHVFNFPVAIQNCMNLLKPGGTLFLFTPINNYCGHGFYQFSPELFYRVLAPVNGFQVDRMVALESAWYRATFLGVPYYYEVQGRWYAVPDPASLRKRITLINSNSTVVMVQARKTRQVDVLRQAPQQSDYSVQWDAAAESAGPPPKARRSFLVNWLLQTFGESACLETLPRIAGWLDPFRLARSRRKESFHNREFYRPQ